MALASLQQLELDSDPWKDGHRPDYCTEGLNVNICTNFVTVTKAPNLIYCYSVELGHVVPSSSQARGSREIKTKAEMTLVLKALGALEQLKIKPYAFLPDCTMVFTSHELEATLLNQILFSNVKYNKRGVGTDTVAYVKLRSEGSITFNNRSSDLVGTPNQQPIHPDTQAMLNAYAQIYPSTQPNIVKIGSNRFFSTDVAPKTSQKLEPLVARPGYNITVKAAEVGPGVTINTTTACFLRHETRNGQPMLLSEFIETLKAKIPVDVGTQFLSQVLRGVRVRVVHDRGMLHIGSSKEVNLDNEENRVKFIEALDQPANEKLVQLPNEQGVKQTVARYVQSKYGITLRKPHLHCVNVGMNHLKHPEKAIWFPPELLSIMPHQAAHPALQQLFVSGIIEVATRGAIANRNLIRNDGLKAMGLTTNNVSTVEVQKRPLQGSGFQFRPELLELQGKLLKTPKVVYSAKVSPSTREAAWNLAQVQKFTQCREFLQMKNLPILWIHAGKVADNGKFSLFLKTLEAQLARHGSTIRGPQIVKRDFYTLPFLPTGQLDQVALQENVERDQFGKLPVDWVNEKQAQQADTFEKKLLETFEVIRQREFPLVLVLLPDNKKTIYGYVKRAADLHQGVASTCINFGKPKPPDESYLSNVISKMNLKLGGVAHTATMAPGATPTLKLAGLIVMGADVVHLGANPGMRGCPSIVSVVGSVENTFATYPASVRAQRSLQETVQDLTIMVTQRLHAWKEQNQGAVPEGIMFFRDGVSDSQFEAVRRMEIPAIQAAWANIEEFASTPLKLNFIVVSKRHSTRFYPSMEKHTLTSRNDNVATGLLVDRTITHPYEFDFYLQAHQALQGTARPAHYYVLRNDLQLKANAMTAFTHMLHYLNGRATKGISYATPTFFADVCCNHATHWMQYKLVLEQEKLEPRDDFLKRCLDHYLAGNPEWNAATRPGPWHPKLDNVMFYL